MTAAEAKRAYMREWRAKNRDKIRANNARYWERKAQQATENAQERQKTEKSGGAEP